MRDNNRPIFVTQPSLPPLNEFVKLLENIWENKIITNNGPFHIQFENAIVQYLGVNYISLFTNGTIALITALKALNITGEVITTPYSFVATTHALSWNGLTPVFVDIEPEFMNLDPTKIEAAITENTTAILPVHVYGNPCNIDEIKKIAGKYGLKVIYDAAHAFGVKNNGTSILNQGDLSVLSFHATKVFNTIEGGAIVCQNEETKKQIDYLKNFGFEDETTINGTGINARMNELNAAYGILQLKYLDTNIKSRKNIANYYRQQLEGISGIQFLNDIQGVEHNYSYFPILINPIEFGKTRDAVYERFKLQNIYTRKYFYPLISQIPIYKGLPSSETKNLPVATLMADQVLCLPFYPNLTAKELKRIVDIIKN